MQTFEPIRIVVDKTHFTSSPLLCTSVGQVVTLTGPGGGSVTCQAADLLTSAKQLQINTELDAVVKLLSSMLRVVPLAKLQLGNGVCGAYAGVQIPQVYVSPGVTNADIVIFLTAWPTLERLQLAWAISCRTLTSGRPVMAQVCYYIYVHWGWSGIIMYS